MWWPWCLYSFIFNDSASRARLAFFCRLLCCIQGFYSNMVKAFVLYRGTRSTGFVFEWSTALSSHSKSRFCGCSIFWAALGKTERQYLQVCQLINSFINRVLMISLQFFGRIWVWAVMHNGVGVISILMLTTTNFLCGSLRLEFSFSAKIWFLVYWLL